ncbi:hypothetical protein ACMD2_10933 [Ananas comosus]|uniref:Uncharacterized protein n=1 Tax=Ananas comosus TaxID=4615 RepID=A0A199V601_ANACO|nr:hypothetical protein ACMD2_10933 [Ananas comosus]
MEELWKKVYRGDSGVPHSDPQRLVVTWSGCFAFAAVAWFNTQTSSLATRARSVNLQDKSMMFEHQQWKKLLEKKKILENKKLYKSLSEKRV